MLEKTRFRSNLIEQLIKTPALAGVTIYNARLHNITSRDCPAVNVYFLGETRKDTETSCVSDLTTVLDLKIDIHVNSSLEGWADQLDTLCETVKLVLLKQPVFSKEHTDTFSYATLMHQKSDRKLPVASATVKLNLPYGHHLSAFHNHQVGYRHAYVFQLPFPANDNVDLNKAERPST